MKLNLTRPIIFFDLETTGTNVTKDRIVEISLIKVMPDGSDSTHTTLVNPGMPIPPESTAVHHITDEMVANQRSFKEIAESLYRFFDGCDIAGFNSNKFDLPMLCEEFGRAGLAFDLSQKNLIDVQNIFHKKEPRTLSAAYKFYCGENLENAHSAAADTRATYEVMKAQLDKYDDLANDMESLAKFSQMNNAVDLMARLVYDENGREVINFGKYKGEIAEDVLRRDTGYYSWILQGDFPCNTKDSFTRIMQRIKNVKK